MGHPFIYLLKLCLYGEKANSLSFPSSTFFTVANGLALVAYKTLGHIYWGTGSLYIEKPHVCLKSLHMLGSPSCFQDWW